MRILIVNNYAHVTGGADLHCLEITEGLRDRGHDVEWLATRSSENVETSGAFVPLRVTTGNRDELSLGQRADAARRSLWNPDAAAGMEALVDRFSPDVVHVHKAYVQLSVAPVVIAARRNVPIVQTVHDYEFISASPFDSDGRRWDHNESKFAYQAVNSLTFPIRRWVHRPRVSRWIAVSRTVAGHYRAKGGIDCEVIPNFSIPVSVDRAPRSDREGIAFLGRLTREKGIPDLLEAARLMPETRFRIAGDGPLRGAVESSAESLGNVEYLGFVGKQEGAELIRSSVACLMPSVWEDPGPLACLEAMAEGTPLVTYPLGGVAEYVEDAGAGIVCQETGARRLVDAIATLSSDPKLWERCSSSGVAAIEGVHSRDRYLDSLEGVYRSAAR